MGSANTKNLGESEPSAVKTQLSSVKVERIHVKGLGRTKDDLIANTVKDLYNLQDFQAVWYKATEIRTQLEKLGCFGSVKFHIEQSKQPNASPSDVEITFAVKELKRFQPLGLIDKDLGNNEVSAVAGGELPNLFGRGEKLQGLYTYGTKQSSGFNFTFTKPLHNKTNTILGSSLFKRNSDWSSSGYRVTETGISLDAQFDSGPQVSHKVQWEGIWRELSSLNRMTTFPVREQAGHSLKSAIRHIINFDNRDSPIFPNRGTLFRMTNELAGIGGDVGFRKHEMQYQVNVPVFSDVVLQASLHGGLLKRFNGEKPINICDRFFLGGPHSVRGFEHRGIGPHSDNQSLGAQAYWAGGLHLFTPLPFRPGRGGIVDDLRTHFFVNAGNIGDFQFTENMKEDARLQMGRSRISYGMGLALKLGPARIELNYCIPLRSQRGDRAAPGVQFSVSSDFP